MTSLTVNSFPTLRSHLLLNKTICFSEPGVIAAEPLAFQLIHREVNQVFCALKSDNCPATCEVILGHVCATEGDAKILTLKYTQLSHNTRQQHVLNFTRPQLNFVTNRAHYEE